MGVSGRQKEAQNGVLYNRSILFFCQLFFSTLTLQSLFYSGTVYPVHCPATRLNNQPALFKFTMQFKLLAALLFGATALALPQATGTSSPVTDDETALLYSIPTSILAVMETAIPSSWLSEFMDPSSRDSIISEIAAGTMPAWYNSLPSSVKAWATTAGGNFADALLGGSPVATATGMATADANAPTGPASVAIATATGSSGSAGSAGSSAAVSSLVSSASSVTTSKAASASSAASSAHASATSTGGAPVATGGVALSVAGVAGILGLALAL